MKRTLTILLSLLLSISMLIPQVVLAAEDLDLSPSAQTSMTENDISEETSEVTEEPVGDAGLAEEASGSGADAFTNEDEAPDADEAVDGYEATDAEGNDEIVSEEPGTEETVAEEPVTEEPVAEEPVAGDYTFDPLRLVSMPALYDSGKLLLPESMTEPVSEEDSTPKVTVKKTKYREGLLLEGTANALSSDKIVIADEFDFGETNVGRISFDGLSDRVPSVTVHMYLDDGDTPIASFPLRKQTGKKAWFNNGDISVDKMSEPITGKHRVSFGFEISGIKGSKSTSIAIRSLEFCECTVPVMYFHIDESLGSISAMNSSEDHSVECYGTVDLKVPDSFNNDETFREDYGVQETKNGLQLEYIRGRGNSTWSGEKRPYKVKFDKKQDLFGFGANKHWVLLANRFDNSLIRNRMTYWLGRKLGLDYTPDCVPVDVVMNGEYYGSYLLCEQIRIGDGRVEIDDLDDTPQSDDPFINSGGYLLSMDYGNDDDEGRSFMTDHEMNLYVESPSFEDEINPYQLGYIKSFVASTEAAIFGKDFKDSQGKSYTEYLDFDSAVDYWWVQEFSANGDAYTSGSTYMYKKRDSSMDQPEKLYWGPLWDFDYVAWGDLDYGIDANEGLNNTSCSWFNRLLTNKSFLERIVSRWSEEGGLRDLLNQITESGGVLDRYLVQMEPSYTYDHEKYGSYNEYYEDEYDESADQTVRSYEDEIEQLRAWILARKQNVETAVSEISFEEHTVRFVLDGKTISEITLLHGSTLAALPDAPVKKGYIFEGWCDNEGFAYSEDNVITEDIVLTGKYIKEDKAVAPKNLYFDTYDRYALFSSSELQDNEDICVVDFSFQLMPENATEGTIVWSSSDESVASFNEDGMLEAHKFGYTVITGKLWNGVKNSFKLHIMDSDEYGYIGADEVSLSSKAIKLEKGKYTQLKAKLTPEFCTTMNSAWFSTNPDVADVNYLGIVSAYKPGTATIIYFLPDDSKYATCKVTVTKTKAALIKEAKARKVTLKAKALKNHKVRLTWKKSKGASGYYIYRATKKNGKYKRVATIKKGTTLKWTSKKLKRGKKYYYKVKPFTRISGKTYLGKWSNKAGAKVR